MRNNFIFLLLLISNIAVSQVYWFYQTERKLGQFGNYNPPSSDTVDYDTIYINWTSFGISDVDTLPWNDADVNNLTALPPATILSNVYSVKGDTLGPLTRTSDTSSSQSWTATATYTYAGWPVKVSQRLIQTDDTMSFNLAGFEPNQEVTFRIFGGGASSAYADEQIVIIGDSVNLVTGLYQQASNELSLAYGTADASGNLSFSMCCPQGGATWAYWKGMEIITGFVEGGTGPEPPPPPPSNLAAKIMSAKNIDYITDSNEGWEVIYEGTPNTYENHYYQDGYAVFDEKVNDWDGVTFNGILAGEEQRGLALNFTRGKQTFLNPWQINYYLKMPIQVDSVGYYNSSNWGEAGTWDDQWIKISGANQWGEWITLKDSIRGTDSNQWVWIDVDCPDTLSIIRIQRFVLDMNNLGGNVVFRNPLTMALYGDLDSNSIDTLENIPNDLYKNGLTYKNRLGTNDVIVTTPDSIGKHFDNVRMYWNLAQMHMKGPVNDTAEKWVISPTAFDVGNVGITGEDGNPVRALRHYLQDNLKAKRDAGVNFIVLCMERGLKNLMTDTDISGTDLDISSTYYVEDTADGARWQDGEYIEYTTPYMAQNYDYRQEVYESYHDRTMYVTDPTTPNQNGDLIFSPAKNPEYQPAPDYFVPNALKESHPFKGPQVYVNAFNNPSKRDSLMNHPETFSHLAELTFCLGAVFGSNTTIPKAHIDQYLQPGQLYEVGQGLINAIAKHQEPNKTWKGSSGHWKPEWAAMAISTMYDGHLGTACDTCGIWTADTSLYFSMGGDMRLNGSQIIETFNWLKYYRQQVYDTLTSTTHPYNGIEMRVIPKLHFDVHHYWSTMGGQGRDINIIEPSDPVSKAAPPEHPNFLDEQKQFMQWCRKNLPSDARIVCSEYGFGPNSGAPFSIKREDIGVPFPFSSIHPYPEDTINAERIFYRGDYFWATAERSGGTGADSIDMGPSAYAVALEKRGEQLLWRWGIPYVDKFMSWDPAALNAYSAVMLDSVIYPAATDWDYWYGMSGNDGNKFAYMGFYKKGPPGEVRISDQTYPQVNVSNTMRDYEFWNVSIEESDLYVYTWRNTIDTNVYIKRVWRPTLKNDTTYNQTIFLHEDATDVKQINCYVKSFNPVIDTLGDVSYVITDVIEIEKMFQYTVDPSVRNPQGNFSLSSNDLPENRYNYSIGQITGGTPPYKIQTIGEGTLDGRYFFYLDGDTLKNKSALDYERFYTGCAGCNNVRNQAPFVIIEDSVGAIDTLEIDIINETIYDGNGFATLGDKNFHAQDGIQIRVGDYLVRNWGSPGGYTNITPTITNDSSAIRFMGGYWSGGVRIDLSNAAGTSENNYRIITNFAGQMLVRGKISFYNAHYFRITGKYDSLAMTGTPYYNGSIHDAFADLTFGILIDQMQKSSLTPNSAGVTFDNAESYSNFEFDHIYTINGGVQAYDIKDDGGGNFIVQNVKLHDLGATIIKNEQFYIGNTKSVEEYGPQQGFQNVRVYNNKGTFLGGEFLQFTRSEGGNYIYNNTAHSGINILNPFQINQSGWMDLTPRTLADTLNNNVAIGGNFIVTIYQTKQYNREIPDSRWGDGSYHKKSLFYGGRGKGGFYVNYQNEIAPWKGWDVDSIWVGNTKLNYNEIYKGFDEDYTTSMYASDALGAGYFNVVNAFRDSTVDLAEDNNDAVNIISAYQLDTIPKPRFENFLGFDDLTTETKNLLSFWGVTKDSSTFHLDSLHLWYEWSDSLNSRIPSGNQSVKRGPKIWRKGEVAMYTIPEANAYVDAAAQYYWFYCVKGHSGADIEPGVSEDWQQYWVKMIWERPDGMETYYPPSDMDLIDGSYYEQMNMGLSDNPQKALPTPMIDNGL